MFFSVLGFMSLCSAVYLVLRHKRGRARFAPPPYTAARRRGCAWQIEGPGALRCQVCGALARSDGRGGRPGCKGGPAPAR